MKRSDFQDTERFKHMGTVYISSVFVPNHGSPEVDVFLEKSTGIAYQVFKEQYGELFRKSADKPSPSGLHPYEEWLRLS